jgi:hypothetical protein
MAEPREKKTTAQQIRVLKLRINELEQDYVVQLYFETMPEYNPTYSYCYSTSNRSIPFALQHVDYWLRAVIKHMALRKQGHGGAFTDSVLVEIPVFKNKASVEAYIDYVTAKLRNKIRVTKPSTAKPTT